jgi:hypothetical protein
VVIKTATRCPANVHFLVAARVSGTILSRARMGSAHVGSTVQRRLVEALRPARPLHENLVIRFA